MLIKGWILIGCCNKVQGSRKEDEEVRGDEPQTGV